MYISRLVKTRDPYPGLLQFAIGFIPPFNLPSLLRLFLWSLPFIHLYFSTLRLSISCGSAVRPTHTQGTYCRYT
jgi:hypothetical protein